MDFFIKEKHWILLSLILVDPFVTYVIFF